jgi:predicted ester cyclase
VSSGHVDAADEATTRNTEVVRRLFQEAWSEGRLDVLDELVSPAYRSHEPSNPEPVVGVDGVRDLMREFRSAFPDLSYAVDEQLAERDLVATRWTASGTHLGLLRGLAATGLTATFSGISLDRLDRGVVVEDWTSWDAVGLMRSLGGDPDVTARTDVPIQA